MLKEVQTLVERINDTRRRYKTWQQVVAVLGFITVFCTTYALILPAITLESSPDAICGVEEHTHTSDCYARKSVLICENTDPDHVHTDDCYKMESVLVCGKKEHAHTKACFPKEEPKEEKVIEPEEPTTPSKTTEEVKDSSAAQTSETEASETKASETEASETQASETEASETQASETEASETQASETEASETQASETEETTTTEETQATEETEPSEIEEELEEYESKTVIRRAGLLNPKMMKTESESPMQLKKTVSSKPNDDGYYTITLEAYAKGSGSIEFHTSVAPTDIVLVLDQSGSMNNTMDGRRKCEILQEAVEKFIDQVIESVKGSDKKLGSDDDVAHRIAMVGFSDSDSNYTGVFLKTNGNQIKKMSRMSGNDYKNAFYNMTVKSDRTNIYTAKNNIRVHTSTYINLGMQMAEKIFYYNEDPTRNRLVVVFTDGVPGSSPGGGWVNSSDVQQDSGKHAEAAIATSNQLKSNYKATVYSIGVFAGANASKDGKVWNDSTWTSNEEQAAPYANYFMHHLSSNYNSKGEQVDTVYYMSASSASALIDAFKTIAEYVQTGGSQNPELKDNTTVIDAVSDYFEFPEGGDLSNVKVYTVKSTALDGAHNPTFDNPKEVLTATVSKSSDGKSISVKGFDFSENWCGYIKEGDTYKVHPGKKMVIEIPVKPKDDFIGGYDVPTNKDNSGVYLNGEQIGTFEVPTTDVAFKGEAYAAEKTVYYGTEVSMDDLYFSNEGLTKKLWDKLTDYVDFIKTNGHKSGNYYVIGNTEYEIELPDFTGSASNAVVQSTETDAHTVKIRMRKKSPAGEWKGYNVSAKINVLVPELKWKDSRVLSGESYSNELCLTHLVEGPTWVLDTTGEKPTGEVEGTAPELKYTFTDTANAVIGSDYQVINETPVNVTVETKAGLNLTDVTKFKWDSSCDVHGNADNIPDHKGSTGDPEFYIHAYLGVTLPATGGSGIKLWLVIGLTLMSSPIMIGLSIKRRLALINVF